MSYSAFDASGYLGDVASIGGWGGFCTWAEEQGGEIEYLAAYGWSDDPTALAAELADASSDDPDTDAVRSEVEALARKADDVLIISDGSDGDDSISEGDLPGHEFHGNQWTGGIMGVPGMTRYVARHPDGFTVEPVSGKSVGSGYAVALSNKLSRIISAHEFKTNAAKHIAAYLKMVRNQAAHNQRVKFGGWFDRQHNEFVLDHVEVFPNTTLGRRAAISVGRTRDQQAIFHLGKGKEIPTGGTGGREQ